MKFKDATLQQKERLAKILRRVIKSAIPEHNYHVFQNAEHLMIRESVSKPPRPETTKKLERLLANLSPFVKIETRKNQEWNALDGERLIFLLLLSMK